MYDDWKTTPPEDSSECLMDRHEDDAQDEPETPTRTEELDASLGHLRHAREAVTKAYRSAVLSRDRRAALEAIENTIFDAIYELELEREARAA